VLLRRLVREDQNLRAGGRGEECGRAAREMRARTRRRACLLAAAVARRAEVGHLALRLAAALAEQRIRQLGAPDPLVDLARPVGGERGGRDEQHLTRAAAARRTAARRLAARAAAAPEPLLAGGRADQVRPSEGVDEGEGLERLA
jgi:hypothetical protein